MKDRWKKGMATILASMLVLVTLAAPVTAFAESDMTSSGDTTQAPNNGSRILSMSPTKSIPVESLTFSNITDNQLILIEGTEFEPLLSVAPVNATNKDYTVESEDENIVSVDEDDILHGEAEGITRITYEADDGSGVTLKLWVKVVKKVKKVTKLTLKTTSKTIYVKRYFMLKAVLKPRKVTNKKLTYVSSNSKIVTVSKKGKIRGIKPGIAVVTVKTSDGSNISATCTITVKEQKKIQNP